MVADDVDVVAHGTVVVGVVVVVANDLPDANSGLAQTPDAVADVVGNGADEQAPDQQFVELQTCLSLHIAHESALNVVAWEEHPNRQQGLLLDR